MGMACAHLGDAYMRQGRHDLPSSVSSNDSHDSDFLEAVLEQIVHGSDLL